MNARYLDIEAWPVDQRTVNQVRITPIEGGHQGHHGVEIMLRDRFAVLTYDQAIQLSRMIRYATTNWNPNAR
jgi:hypothetical protein